MTKKINLKSENWLPVLGFEGIYEVSNTGRVRSFDRWVTIRHGKGGVTFKKGTVLVGGLSVGYRSVRLWNDGKGNNRQIHRLVATAFIPNPENKEQVNHKDRDRLNNHVDNLEWATRLENVRHSCVTGDPIRKTRVPIYSLDNCGVKTIYTSIKQACDETGIDRRNIYNGLRNNHQKNKGLYFRYLAA